MDEVTKSSGILDDGGTDHVFDYPRGTALPDELVLQQAKEGYVLEKTHVALATTPVVTQFVFRYKGVEPHNLPLQAVILWLAEQTSEEEARAMHETARQEAVQVAMTKGLSSAEEVERETLHTLQERLAGLLARGQ